MIATSVYFTDPSAQRDEEVITEDHGLDGELIIESFAFQIDLCVFRGARMRESSRDRLQMNRDSTMSDRVKYLGVIVNMQATN